MDKIINKITYKGNVIGISTPFNNDVLKSLLTGSISGEFKDTNGFITKVRPYCFEGCVNLQEIDLPACLEVGESGFSGIRPNQVNLQNCKYIKDNAFLQASIGNLEIPNCISVGVSALRFRTSMSSLNLPYCEYVASNGGNLFVLDFIAPNCKEFGSSAFSGAKISRAIYPNCLKVGDGCFRNCASLKVVDLRNCSAMGSEAFSGCTNLSSVNLTMIATLPTRAFLGCSSLTNITIPSVKGMGVGAFFNCTNLTSISIAGGGTLGSSAFGNCTALSMVVIKNRTSIASNTFMSTPILDSTYLGYYGSVYVPSSLLSYFKTSSWWSSIADRITSLENLPI